MAGRVVRPGDVASGVRAVGKRPVREAMHAPSHDGHDDRAGDGPGTAPAHHLTVGPDADPRAALRRADPCLRPRAAPTSIDTSVLLSDPHALRRFAEHDVILPVVVITELEAKRHHAELGYFARTALRYLDDLRLSAGRLDAPLPVNDLGGTVHVELNHTDPTALPDGFRLGDNDSRILAVALNFAAEGRDVTLVSKDLPMRVKASAVGLRAEEYRAELAVSTEWTGMTELEVERRPGVRPSTTPACWTSRRPATCPATPASCC